MGEINRAILRFEDQRVKWPKTAGLDRLYSYKKLYIQALSQVMRTVEGIAFRPERFKANQQDYIWRVYTNVSRMRLTVTNHVNDRETVGYEMVTLVRQLVAASHTPCTRPKEVWIPTSPRFSGA